MSERRPPGAKPRKPAAPKPERGEPVKSSRRKAPAAKPDPVRMPDKRPDNWEISHAGTPEFAEAVAKLNEQTSKQPVTNPRARPSAVVHGTTDDVEDWLDGATRPRDIVDARTAEGAVLTNDVQPTRAFRDQAFAQANIGLISDYADYRVMGWNPERAFIRVFGTDYGDMHLFARIEALEHNLVYRQVFAKRFGSTPLSRMFSIKHAIWHWLSLLNNPFSKDTSKTKAIESLQVIYGITVVDEAGNTKAVKTLDDFYRDEQARDPNANESNPQAFRHPNPGSEEAIALEAKIRGTSASETPS